MGRSSAESVVSTSGAWAMGSNGLPWSVSLNVSVCGFKGQCVCFVLWVRIKDDICHGLFQHQIQVEVQGWPKRQLVAQLLDEGVEAADFVYTII